MGTRIFSKKFSKLFLALSIFVTLGVGCGGGGESDTIYYVALGDSLSVGVQPDGNGENQRTDEGYADQLFQALVVDHPNLQLVKFGCPSETTTSMIAGGICEYEEGSQLDEAVRFILDHQDKIILVTMDIGVNDILSSECVDGTNVDQACLMETLEGTGANLTIILSKLFNALDGNAPLIGMNYYNTFLAAWLLGQQEFAMLSQQLVNAFNNDVLGAVYALFGFPVADVSAAFMSNDFTTMVPFPPPFNEVPINVALICQLTWMCAPPPQGPNIHANAQGYGLIAQTFLAVFNDVTSP